MPLIASTAPVVVPPPRVAQFPGALPTVTAMWLSPDGSMWDLTAPVGHSGISLLTGVAGLGAAPRQTIRQALAIGGTVGRWSYADERILTLPLLAHADAGLAGMWSAFVRAVTSTTPPAGPPLTGRLRVVDVDSTWREIEAVYLSGLEGADDGYVTGRPSVLQLVCPEPWFYGQTTAGITFDYTAARSYLAPYETVSPTTQVGTSTAHVEGDVATRPVWTLIGPGSSYTVTAPAGTFTYTVGLATGQTVTVDVENLAVTDANGVNVIGNLSWPGSQLFTLPAGDVTVTVAIVGAGTGAGVHLTYKPCYEQALG